MQQNKTIKLEALKKSKSNDFINHMVLKKLKNLNLIIFIVGKNDDIFGIYIKLNVQKVF